MSITLKKLLTLPSLKEAKLINGDKNSKIEISNVMVLEAPDVSRWAKKGQLLLSSLYTIQDFTELEQIDFIHELNDIGVSGLIIKIDRFIDHIPNGILVGAHQTNFPLIQIPDNVSYESVMINVMQHLFNQKVTLLDHYRNVHLEMMTLALNPKEAGIENSISKLQSLIGKDITLTIDDKIFTTNPHFQPFEVIKLTEKKKSVFNFEYYRQLVTYPKSNELGQVTQLVIPININSPRKCFLIIHELDHSISDMDLMVIENTTLIIKLEILKDDSIKQVKKNLINDIFDDLVYGKFNSHEELTDLITFLKLDETLNYRAIVWRFDTDSANTHNIQPNTSHSVGQQLISQIKIYYPNIVYRIRNNRIIFLINNAELKKTQLPSFISILKMIHNNLVDKTILFQIGISDETTLELIHHETKRALQIIQQAEIFIGNSFALTFEDLGLYRIFSNLVDDDSYGDYIPANLQLIVKDYPAWLETLKLFLDYNQSYKRVSEKLFIHEKTVQYRVERMHQLTNFNLSNPEEVLQLQIGLRLLLLQDRKQ